MRATKATIFNLENGGSRGHLSSEEGFGFRNFKSPSFATSADKRSVSHFPRKTRLRIRECGLLFSPPPYSSSVDSVNRLNKNEHDKVTPPGVSSENATTPRDSPLAVLRSILSPQSRHQGLTSALSPADGCFSCRVGFGVGTTNFRMTEENLRSSEAAPLRRWVLSRCESRISPPVDVSPGTSGSAARAADEWACAPVSGLRRVSAQRRALRSWCCSNKGWEISCPSRSRDKTAAASIIGRHLLNPCTRASCVFKLYMNYEILDHGFKRGNGTSDFSNTIPLFN